ncbi:LysR family transcriptional regulator [Sodalis endosymbiont of Spalangia cameroni]|uniref:LysR family transcriptional regulator n=1 Tax=Sodalis praecaptivus TaxID=1239307 RepID=UPI0031F7AF52
MAQLDNLDIFVQVVKSGSFVAAARVTGLSPSAVSKAMTRLEQHLATRLMNRNTRSMALTTEGMRFYERCVGILNAVEEARNELLQANHAPSGTLRLSLAQESQAFPWMTAFAAKYPDIVLDLDFSDRLVDVIEEGYDVALRSGHVADSRLMARKITTFSSSVVASPAYLKRSGAPETPADLAGHACLHYRFPHSGKLELWQLKTFSPAQFAALPLTMVCNNMHARRDFARKGLGLAWLPDYYVQEDLRRGSLVGLLEDFSERCEPLWALWPAGPFMPLKSRVFIDFLCESLGDGAAVGCEGAAPAPMKGSSASPEGRREY